MPSGLLRLANIKSTWSEKRDILDTVRWGPLKRYFISNGENEIMK